MGQSKGKIVTSASQGNNYSWQRAMLEMQTLLFKRLTGSGGSVLVDNTGPVTDRLITEFIVQEDTVITTLTGGVPPGETTDYLISMNLGGVTLHQGALVRAPEGQYFVNITVSSGSLMAYE